MDSNKLTISYFNLIDYIALFDNQADATYVDTESMLLVSLQRDIRNLLNTRIPLIENIKGDILSKSLLAYGIRDFSGFILQSTANKEELRISIVHALETFEARLKNIAVEITENSNDTEGSIDFKITGGLYVPTTLLPVYFNFIFDRMKANFKIKEANYA